MPLGRPLRIPGLRTAPLNIRVNAREKALIARAAARVGLPPSTFIRETILSLARNPEHRQLPRWLPET